MPSLSGCAERWVTGRERTQGWEQREPSEQNSRVLRDVDAAEARQMLSTLPGPHEREHSLPCLGQEGALSPQLHGCSLASIRFYQGEEQVAG